MYVGQISTSKTNNILEPQHQIALKILENICIYDVRMDRLDFVWSIFYKWRIIQKILNVCNV